MANSHTPCNSMVSTPSPFSPNGGERGEQSAPLKRSAGVVEGVEFGADDGEAEFQFGAVGAGEAAFPEQGVALGLELGDAGVAVEGGCGLGGVDAGGGHRSCCATGSGHGWAPYWEKGMAIMGSMRMELHSALIFCPA